MREKFRVYNILIIFVLIMNTILYSKTIVVPDKYPKISIALNNAEPGDTIFVRAGVYKENIVLVDEVVLIGEDKYTTIIDGGRKTYTVKGADYAYIGGFTIKGGYGAGILCENTSPIIENNIIKDNRGAGIMAVLSLPMIRNNIIYGNEWTGIYLEAAKSLDTKIDHNVIVENGYHGIYCGDESNVLITNNIIYKNKGFGVFLDETSKKTRLEYNDIYANLMEVSKGYIVSATNINKDPLFKDDKTFEIKELSPCKKTGEDGTDIGLDYNMSTSLPSMNQLAYQSKEGDADGDGIADTLDNCPNLSEDKDGYEDNDGCPDKDNDDDGILDDKDLCKNEAEDLDNFEDNDGCPDLDNDGDGILDTEDKCPNDVETFNDYKDYDGCPDTIPKKFPKKLVLPGIKFEPGSAKLLPESYIILDDVAKQLKRFPNVIVEIGGHTDNTGSRRANMRLSLERAKAVKRYLVKKWKINPRRLKVKGYGPDFPVADNSTEEGRAQNRRIEFKVLKY